MDARVFEGFKALIYAQSGITLGPQKVALVNARVGKRMRALNLDSPAEYLRLVENDRSGGELILLLDAISTNVTSFYRESVHFNVLSDLLARWRAGGQRRFRIWCAASSSGEEPYCLAMTGLEALGPSPDLRILATDISTRVLQAAKRGFYEDNKIAPVPKPLLQKYFTPHHDGPRRGHIAQDALKRVLSFCRLNLSQPPFPMRGPFDVVFCRNVMIYFDLPTRTALIREIERLLRPGGYLMIGHSETLTGTQSGLVNEQPAVYKKRV
jgi:chemotaxis protein methyltransferase CheR